MLVVCRVWYMRCGQINGPASQAIVRPKINF